MKLDPRVLFGLVQRKCLSVLAGAFLGAVWVASDEAALAFVRQGIAVFGGVGGVAVLLSTLQSVANEASHKEEVQVALLTEPPKEGVSN